MHFSCLKRDKKTKKPSYIYLALDSIIWRWQYCIKSAPLLHHFCKLLSIRPLKGLYKYSRVQKTSRISDTRSAVEKTLSTLTWVFAIGVSLFNSIKISKIKCVAQLFHSGCTHGHTTSTLGLSWENRLAASDTGWRDEALACPSRPQKRCSTVWDELGRFEVIWGSRTHSSPPAGVLSHCGYRLLPAVVFQGFKGHSPGVPGGWWPPRASQYLPRTSCLLLHILCSSTPMTHHWLIDNMTIWSDSLGLLHSHIALSAWALPLMTQLLQTQLEEKLREEKCFV